MGLTQRKAMVAGRTAAVPVRTLSSRAEELVQEEGSMVAHSRGSRRRGAQLGRGQEVVVRMEVAMVGVRRHVVGRTEHRYQRECNAVMMNQHGFWSHWPHHV